VVLFMEGTLKEPQANLSASVVKALLQSGLAFKAVDCLDEKYNPGVKKAVEALSGETQLPQLFAGGRRLGNGNDILELSKNGDLATKLRELGAVD
ncbi:GRXS12, partial [Symbiodinium sp. CCMP2592]